ncbi:MAG: disulfide bond formation protein DsbB [Litorilituus sp.]|jgi:disulfide bond formation protein DsbB|nr:disulfide bond formation protein DsbB [Litorilituus sp.]
MKFLSDLTIKQKPWLLISTSALGLELCAFFFQYSMDLAPCIMCVYQRLAVATIFFAGVIGCAGHSFLFTRVIAYGLWLTGGIWGGIIALEHVEMQSNSGSIFFSCELIPNFPNWAPLHEWIPSIFEATGDCGEISWQFLSLSMPQWMVVVFAFYSLAAFLVLINRFIHAKRL